MTAKFMTMRRTCLMTGSVLALLLVSAPITQAQSIEVEGLDAAKAFAPGIDVAGELPRTAWSGTDAQTAVDLLGAIQTPSAHPIVRDMRRRVVLAGLAPPSGADERFDRARVEAAQILATPDEYMRFAARNPAARDPQLRAEAALTQGDLPAACEMSDTIVQGRGDTFWVRIRAACHEMRDEIARADLARDLLRDRGEDPDLIIPTAPEGFWVEAMRLGDTELIAFMTTQANWPEDHVGADMRLGTDIDMDDTSSRPIDLRPEADDQTDFDTEDEIITTAGDVVAEATGDALVSSASEVLQPEITVADALTDETDQGTARLFLMGRNGNAQAVSAFVRRAVDAGLDANRIMARIPALLDPTEMAIVDLPLFARYAVATGDIPLIQALFVATDNPVLQQRLALASDALGGAYFGQPLGEGLETDLEAGGPIARGDVMIALGLGARLSERAEIALRNDKLAQTDLLDWVGVDQALDRGGQAETLLRLAALIPDQGITGETGSENAVTLYRTLRALRQSGFSDLAGRLAAYEFLRGL